MKCKGCGIEKPLIDAHIIPKSFFMNLRGPSNYLHVVGPDKVPRQTKSNKGEYDKGILCSECDGKFQIFDDYAKKLLIDSKENFVEVIRNGKLVGWELENYDYFKLRLFFLSVLWRASISRRPFFNTINLGPHEDIIKKEIFSGPKSKSYEFWLYRYREDSQIDGLEKTILNPDVVKLNGVNFCRIFLHGYIALIKVDQKRAPHIFKRLMNEDSEPLRCMELRFEGSKARQLIVAMAL